MAKIKEHRTADTIEDYLWSLGLQTKRMTMTGVVALLEGAKPGPVLMLRSDMDACPSQKKLTLKISHKIKA